MALDMDSSSVSRDDNDYESTAVTAGTIKPKASKLTELKLNFRRIEVERSDDGNMPHLRSILKTEPPAKTMEEITTVLKDLCAAAQNFANLAQSQSSKQCLSIIDDFSLKLDEAKSKMRYPIINAAYFDKQVKKCLVNNEAVLQRTVMMSLFHHYWLPGTFDWNAEGLWSVPRNTRVPSEEDDKIVSPKPDLSISFTRQSLSKVKSDPIPHDLEECLSPDGGGRCFPFLFIEVKKSSSGLHEAEFANLHNASQALFNIYLWMDRAGHETDFFSKVRIFTFVFNAQALNVRVHRAKRQPGGVLSFEFDEFLSLLRYTRDDICSLIDSILNEYAGGDLLQALRASFTEVIKQERARMQNKRKANARDNRGVKRTRQSDDRTTPAVQSFEMTDLPA